MSGTMMYRMPRDAAWNVDTPEGLANAVERMTRHVSLLADQARWVMRSGSVVVVDKANKRMIRVLGQKPEPSTQAVLKAMGWQWIDKAAGEEVPGESS